MDRSTKIIIELLGKSNLNKSQIADTFEVSEQAIADVADVYATEIAELKAGSTVAAGALDTRLDMLESTLLTQIEEQLPQEQDLRVLNAMYKTINSAVRRGRGEAPTGETMETANIVLNQQFVQNNLHFASDSANRIVQVGDTKLQTANADDVRGMAARLAESLAVNQKALEDDSELEL